jgi:hypothetical protein
MLVAMILKKMGKFFVLMNQESAADIRQSVLLVDGNFILPNNFTLILRGVKEKFKNAKIEILTSEDKTEFLRDNFPEVGIVNPRAGIKNKRLGFNLQLLKLVSRNFDYIVLSSLDIIPVSVCLLLGRSRVFLHNKWLEWYRLRLRTIGDILNRRSSSDKNHRNKNSGIKDVIRSIGRKFVILQDIAEADTKSRILIVDNGYTAIDYILTAVKKTGEIFVEPDVTVLTFADRRHYFINGFTHTEIAAIRHSPKRSVLASVRQMWFLRKRKFEYIILTALDALPAAVALGSNAKKLLLYNRWHQWWSIKFKNPGECLKDAIGMIFAIPVTAYLLIAAGLILLRTFIRGKLLNLKSFLCHEQSRF